MVVAVSLSLTLWNMFTRVAVLACVHTHLRLCINQLSSLHFLVFQGALRKNVVCQQSRRRVHSVAVVQQTWAIWRRLRRSGEQWRQRGERGVLSPCCREQQTRQQDTNKERREVADSRCPGKLLSKAIWYDITVTLNVRKDSRTIIHMYTKLVFSERKYVVSKWRDVSF